MAGFWYFPKYFDTSLQRHARWFMTQELKSLEDMLPSTVKPDFEKPFWAKEWLDTIAHASADATLAPSATQAYSEEAVSTTA